MTALIFVTEWKNSDDTATHQFSKQISDQKKGHQITAVKIILWYYAYPMRTASHTGFD